MLIGMLTATAAAQVNVTVNAGQAVRKVDDRMFALNTAVWDGSFTDAQTLAALQAIDVRFMRFPGGSTSDDYDWQTGDAVEEGGSAGSTTFDEFAATALATHAQVVITTNYGTGTPQMAAAWVQYSNVTKGYGFKYWEVGNECYGTWEDDRQAVAHDPVTYANLAVQYIQAMKAVDPTIKIGVVADASEDSYNNSSSNGVTRTVTNPVTNKSHSGWTPVMLATMQSQGVLPDFLIFHYYAQNAGGENDAALLQYPLSWTSFATTLRSILTDYLGTQGAGIELLCTENNSVSTNPGKQSTSLVNALFMADSVGSLMQTEFNSLIWWDLHNSPGNGGNNAASLYGWREYGDYGIENGDATSIQGSTINLAQHDPYPTFYVQELLTHFARGGDTVVSASTNNTLLTSYAVARRDGSLSLLVVNKSPTATYTGNIAISGFAPKADATVYSYGIPQDENSEENAVAASAPSTGFSWENSLDGWVNQSGQPDTAATNYGLDAPFLYSLAYSQATGVTNGAYSLACMTTNANPGDAAVIQNSTASLGTAMSTASSVSVDIYPEVAAGTTVQASIYLNGTNIPYVLLGTVTLNANQENTATFPLTDAQRTGVTNSLGSGNYFQVGININSPAPITAYFDNFVITPLTAPTPTPTPTPIAGAASSPEVAVTTISNAGTSFSASFAPYSATVISLAGPTSAPAAASQPSSQSIASGSTVVFSFPATGSPTPTYQWSLNGAPISGATSSALVLSGATSSDAGSYTCVATNSAGTATSSPATLTVVSTSNPGRLINLSCRAQVGKGASIMTAGFVVGGNGVSGSQSVLVRGSGPALGIFGLTGLLADPKLTLNDTSPGGGVVDSDTGWGGSPAIKNEAALLGAFSWGSAATPDSALLETLPPNNYTAQIAGASGDTGLALVEVYDATPAGTYTPATPRMINLSALIQDGAGAQSVAAGFVIGGTTARTMLIRASGPALAAPPFGFAGTLSDPQLTLTNTSVTPNQVVQVDTGWGGDATIASAAGSVGAFAWNSSSADSAILITLPPGNYTAGVAGASGDTGLVLIELYEVP
jgi:Immunoglobulin domain